MTTPAYSELVTAVRREGEGILAAAGMGLDADVPTCDNWNVEALVLHITRVFVFVEWVVSTRLSEPPTSRPDVPDGDLLEVFSTSLDALVAALSGADADSPIWNWADKASNTGLFWARRMAHEASVHRYDAQAAHGVVQPIDAELAADGLDELVDIIAQRVYSRDDLVGPTGTVDLQSSDNGTWHLGLEPKALVRLETLAEPMVVARGTSSALLLASYSRVPWSSLDVTGDIDLLTSWTTTMSF